MTTLKLNRGFVDDFCLDASKLEDSDGLGKLLREWGQDVNFDGNLEECMVVGMVFATAAPCAQGNKGLW